MRRPNNWKLQDEGDSITFAVLNLYLRLLLGP